MKRLVILFSLPALLFVLLSGAPSQLAQAQTFQVLYTFTGGTDGAGLRSGLTIDGQGNLYGTATFGGDLMCDPPSGCGTVYALDHVGSNWIFHTLYSFTGGVFQRGIAFDGASPEGRAVFGPDGALYGTTSGGGGKGGCAYVGCGTVFKVQAPAGSCHTVPCAWKEKVLYSFGGQSDGYWPVSADLQFDQAGNIYGTTPYTTYPSNTYGVVYQLTPSGSGYTQSVLHSFASQDGSQPYDGVFLDSSGNLYGTTIAGGLYNGGTVFELSYAAGGGWSETLLHNFPINGANVYAGLIPDRAGNLYGTTYLGGEYGGGVVFELIRNQNWQFVVLYNFPTPACGSFSDLAIDAAGNLYGTTSCQGAYHSGSVFKLALVNGVWTYTSLHDFTGGSDGVNPTSNVTFDASGNLYGTASTVVWEITP